MTNELTTKTVKSYELTIDAMNNVIKEASLVIDELANGCTLNTAKSKLESFVSDTTNLPIGIKEAVKDASQARTKKLYIEAVELVKGRLVDSIKVAMDAIHDIKEADKKKPAKEEKPELNQDELDKLAACVREAIAQSLKFHFEAGRLLSEALEMFKASGKPAKEWLAWANTACNVKKAQAYNLVKIWNDFGEVSEFKGCPMRVLNILVHTSNDLYKKIEEQAKSLAKKGKLDTKAVNNLIDSVKPASKPEPVKPNAVRQDTKPETPDNITKAIEASMNTSNEVGNKGEQTEQGASELRTTESEVTNSKQAAQMDELIKQNQELLKKIAELESKLAAKEENKEEPTKTAVYLPQFEAKSPNLVLGIEATASKAEINKRYRTMAVIFNAKTCPNGAKALKDAKEAMLKAAKN